MRSIMLSCLLLPGWVALTVAQDAGEADLDAAIELKLSASSTRNLDEVADLCESAIEKGLKGRSLESAKQLWASVLLEHGELLAKKIMGQLPPPRRWQFDREQALTRLTKAIELTPDLAEAHLLIARLNILPRGDRDQARTSIDRVIELSEDNPSQKARSLVLRAQLAEDDEARLADLNEALEVDPGNTMALQMRGLHFLSKEDPDKAIDDFKQMAEADENNAAALLLLANTLADNDQIDEALEAIARAIEINPDAVSAYRLRARLLMANDKDDEALTDVAKVLELNPSDVEALLLRSNLYYEKGREDKTYYEKALKDLDKALVFKPGTISAIYMRAFTHAAMENFEAAIKDMSILTDFDRANLQWQSDLAMFYNAANQPRKAIDIYTEVLADEPDNQRALRGRGDARLSTGEHEEAITDYDNALKVEPDDDGVLNNLAWVLATSPMDNLRDGQRSIELGLKACELTDYQAAHILSTLAAGYAETGDFENAKKWAAKAVELGEGDQVANLQKELDSYEEGKPWRELQTVDDKEPNRGGGDLDLGASDKSKSEQGDKAKGDGETEGKQSNKDDAKGSASDGKGSPDKTTDQGSSEKKEDKGKGDGKGGDGKGGDGKGGDGELAAA